MTLDKPLLWNESKNELLKAGRKISFEEIALAIEDGHLIDIIDHPSPVYAHQKALLVDFKGYIVMAPCIETKEHIFIKTAFYHRKANKLFKRKI
jgi:hypothetical protein